MSPKLKRGLHAGLSEIQERQTARPEKSEASKRLIEKFAEKTIPPHGIPSEDIPPPGIPQDASPASLIKPERGYYPTFNDLSDRLIPELKLDAYEQVVLYRLYRLSRGWQKDSCTVGHTKLANGTNLSRSTVQKTVARLLTRGLIENLGERGNDGTEYRVLPGVPVPQRGIPRDGIPSGGEGVPPRGPHRSGGIPRDGHIKNKEDQFKKKDINVSPSSEDLEEYERARKELEGK